MQARKQEDEPGVWIICKDYAAAENLEAGGDICQPGRSAPERGGPSYQTEEARLIPA